MNVMIYINAAIVTRSCLNCRNYHTFNALAMLYCYSHADKAHCCVVIVHYMRSKQN